jgi:hypothetical protein
MRVFFQLVGVVFAIYLLRFAYKLFDRKEETKAMLAASLAVTVFLACMFQGFFETQFIRKLFDYDKKLDAFQQTVSDMKGELSDQQGTIRKTQTDIGKQQVTASNQVYQVSSMEGELSSAQSNLLSQQKQIESVEKLVGGLYSRMRFEKFKGSDTNRVIVCKFKDGVGQVFFKLKYPAVGGSVQGLFQEGAMQTALVINGGRDDIVWAYFKDASAVSGTEFYLSYVRDTATTNSHTVVARGDQVFFDGVVQSFYPSGE